jgi:hypothetical protein
VHHGGLRIEDLSGCDEADASLVALARRIRWHAGDASSVEVTWSDGSVVKVDATHARPFAAPGDEAELLAKLRDANDACARPLRADALDRCASALLGLEEVRDVSALVRGDRSPAASHG